MMVRLGFAVAAHLDPEILVVDEVLAVGDAEFQKKAIGKMQDVSKGEGRTVLFVSHNMTAVKSLCKRGIMIENGLIVDTGDIESVVSHYLKGDSKIDNHKIWTNPAIKKDGFELLEIGVRKRGGEYTDIMRVDQENELIVRYRLTKDFDQFHLTFHFKNEQGEKIFTTTGITEGLIKPHIKGEYEQRCILPANFFNWGTFSIDLFAVTSNKFDLILENDIVSFQLVNKEYDLGSWMEKEPGDVTPHFHYGEERIG
jgi:lipopolysaccharide transport system ATP-binding protein